MKAIVYETGGAERMPLAMLNRYPGQIIGVAFRLPRRRCLSIVWRDAR